MSGQHTEHLETRPGHRVRFVGTSGRADGPTSRVVTVSRAGLRVRWDDGRVERVHPQDVQPA